MELGKANANIVESGTDGNRFRKIYSDNIIINRRVYSGKAIKMTQTTKPELEIRVTRNFKGNVLIDTTPCATLSSVNALLKWHKDEFNINTNVKVIFAIEELARDLESLKEKFEDVAKQIEQYKETTIEGWQNK
jgi:hypothetical protein